MEATTTSLPVSSVLPFAASFYMLFQHVPCQYALPHQQFFLWSVLKSVVVSTFTPRGVTVLITHF